MVQIAAKSIVFTGLHPDQIEQNEAVDHIDDDVNIDYEFRLAALVVVFRLELARELLLPAYRYRRLYRL